MKLDVDRALENGLKVGLAVVALYCFLGDILPQIPPIPLVKGIGTIFFTVMIFWLRDEAIDLVERVFDILDD